MDRPVESMPVNTLLRCLCHRGGNVTTRIDLAARCTGKTSLDQFCIDGKENGKHCIIVGYIVGLYKDNGNQNGKHTVSTAVIVS